MLRGIARGLGLLLIVVGGIILGQGVGLIGGSFMTGHGRWAVTGGVMIAIGIYGGTIDVLRSSASNLRDDCCAPTPAAPCCA